MKKVLIVLGSLLAICALAGAPSFADEMNQFVQKANDQGGTDFIANQDVHLNQPLNLGKNDQIIMNDHTLNVDASGFKIDPTVSVGMQPGPVVMMFSEPAQALVNTGTVKMGDTISPTIPINNTVAAINKNVSVPPEVALQAVDRALPAALAAPANVGASASIQSVGAIMNLEATQTATAAVKNADGTVQFTDNTSGTLAAINKAIPSIPTVAESRI